MQMKVQCDLLTVKIFSNYLQIYNVFHYCAYNMLHYYVHVLICDVRVMSDAAECTDGNGPSVRSKVLVSKNCLAQRRVAYYWDRYDKLRRSVVCSISDLQSRLC